MEKLDIAYQRLIKKLYQSGFQFDPNEPLPPKPPPLTEEQKQRNKELVDGLVTKTAKKVAA